MCGIYGQLTDSKIDLQRAERSTDRLAHRGPDDRGSVLCGNVYLGMRRLSIVDVNGGHQPIWNEDQTCCIVYNGELYNFLDLTPELESRGHRFRTRTDSEVVLHAYEEWGPDCLRRLNGMFGFAVWDQKDKRLFLGRDRIGEKPLYYYQDKHRLIFASEIKAILEDRTVLRELNPGGLANFLYYGNGIGPETMFRKICKVPPGHYLIARDGKIQIKRYWQVGDEPQMPRDEKIQESDYAQAIRSLLDDSIRRRMLADVPVGAFLSGGIDSSAIVALMQRHAGKPVKTFSFGFNIGGERYNELSDAAVVAKHLGTDHHELRAEHFDLVQTLRTLVYHYDEPFSDAASFPLYLLSRFACQQVKVVLSGDGGDELFGGYRRYAADRFAPLYQAMPGLVKRKIAPALVGGLPRMRRTKQAIRSLAIEDPAVRYPSWIAIFSSDMQAHLLEGDFKRAVAECSPVELHRRYYHELNGRTASDHINRMMFVDLKTLLVDCYMEKLDKATMACGLEARVPLLDHRLVELAFQIPGRMKVRGGSLKWIFKKAVSDLIPATVLKKPKHGFAVPIDPWFRGQLKSYVYQVLLDPHTRARGFFDTKFIEQIWREHIDGRHVWTDQLLALVHFELWYRIYMENETV